MNIKKLRSKIKGNVYIEWVKGHNGNEENEIVNRAPKKVRSNSLKMITVSYLRTMISRRAIRDNYPGVLSKYYLFKFTTVKKSYLDKEGRKIE